jgi:hypothetical protein
MTKFGELAADRRAGAATPPAWPVPRHDGGRRAVGRFEGIEVFHPDVCQVLRVDAGAVGRRAAERVAGPAPTPRPP